MLRRLLMIALGVVAISDCGTTGDVPPMPIADAGFDQLGVVIGSTVTLDGSGSRSSSSDPDSGTLTFNWSLDARPDSSTTEIIDGIDDEHPTLTPDRAGGYLISLRVSKNSRDSRVDVVLVEASNGAPIAVAECQETSQTPACQVLHGRTANLIGTLSADPDFASITHSWTQVTDVADCTTACPGLLPCTPDTAVLPITNETTTIASVDFPETKDTMYIFQLTVSDGFDTGTDCISYTTTNTPPAFFGGQTISSNYAPDEGVQFTLSTLPLSEVDGDTLTFAWTQDFPTASGLQVPPDSPDQQTTTVTIPGGTIGGGTGATQIYVYRVTLSDGITADDIFDVTPAITVRVP